MVIYRALSTAVLAALAWIFSGNNATETSIVTILFTVFATVIYYVHERAWNNVKWGVA